MVKTQQGAVTAFGPQCTHLGCAYHWDAGNHEFICPCHSSVFSIEGEVQSGPAPRPLDRYEAKVEKGKLMLGRLRVGRSKRREAIVGTIAAMDRPSHGHRHGCAWIPLRRDPCIERMAPGIRQRGGFPVSDRRSLPARCWRSTTRRLPAMPITACATS